MSFNSVMPENGNRVSSECRLDALKRYLKLRDWALADSNDVSLAYEGPVDDTNQTIRLILPKSIEFEDTSSMISKAIKLLSAIERCSIDSMCQTIMNSGSDFLRPRILTSSDGSNISLSLARKVINDFYGLVYDSACLEEDSQPFFAKRRNIGKKYAERCRFGQTFPGSYGLTIEMPISPSSPENMKQMPFERRIMVRIARGLLAIRKSSQEADVSILINEYKQGFNANLYETVQDLMESLQDNQIEFTFAWSPEYILPQELVNMTMIRLTPASVLPFLESAAKSLRRSSESQDAIILGKIVQLRGDGEIGEEELDESDSSSNGSGMTVIEWETEKGKPCLIRAVLSQEDYKLACNAHRDGKTVSIRGKPEKPGKYLILTSPTDFKVVDGV
jgi:hypothetical protein